MYKLSSFEIALGLLLIGSGCGNSLPEQLTGQWRSSTCEAYPDGSGGSAYVKRDTRFTATDLSVSSTIYTDAACSAGFVMHTQTATYTLGMPSAGVSGATEVDYKLTARTITPLSAAAVTTMNSGMGGTCGNGSWTLNQSGDVSQTGCPILGTPSLTQCPTEYDLTKLDGGILYNADRTIGIDACKNRPTALSPLTLIRAK